MAVFASMHDERKVREMFLAYSEHSPDGTLSYAQVDQGISRLFIDWNASGLDGEKVKAFLKDRATRAGTSRVTFQSLWEQIMDKGRRRQPNDPQVKAENYLRRHRMIELFESMTRALIFHKAKDPKAFLAQRLVQIKASGNKIGVFFNNVDLKAVFEMFDVTNKGTITVKQCNEALRSLGCMYADVHSPELGGYMIDKLDQEMFVKMATKALEGTANPAPKS